MPNVTVKSNKKCKKNEKKVLTGVIQGAIITIVESLSDSMVCGSVGIGRRARLRIL